MLIVCVMLMFLELVAKIANIELVKIKEDAKVMGQSLLSIISIGSSQLLDVALKSGRQANGQREKVLMCGTEGRGKL